MGKSLVSNLEEECRRKGRGRKAWWAKKLGVPPLTISHWLSGRQNPNGVHAVAIQSLLVEIERGQKKLAWEDHLWKCYFAGESVPDTLLPPILLEILAGPALKVRTAALLVRLLRSRRILFTVPDSAALNNRLGWLLESAGIAPTFRPNRSIAIQSLFLEGSGLPSFKHYLKRHQTDHGRKWRIYDSPLDETVRSLP